MRHVLILLVALMVGGLVVITPANKAAAGPVPVGIAADIAPGMIQKVDYWRRYYRRNGYPPVVVVPAPVVEVAPPPAVVETLPPPPPPRPLSCGQYHYWDGEACVDARYTNPYLGPK